MSEQGFTVNQDDYVEHRPTSDELHRDANRTSIAVNEYRIKVQPEETAREVRAEEIRELAHQREQEAHAVYLKEVALSIEVREIEKERALLAIDVLKNDRPLPRWVRRAGCVAGYVELLVYIGILITLVVKL